MQFQYRRILLSIDTELIKNNFDIEKNFAKPNRYQLGRGKIDFAVAFNL